MVKNVLNSPPITTMYKRMLIPPPRAPVHWKVQTQRLALYKKGKNRHYHPETSCFPLIKMHFEKKHVEKLKLPII